MELVGLRPNFKINNYFIKPKLLSLTELSIIKNSSIHNRLIISVGTYYYILLSRMKFICLIYLNLLFVSVFFLSNKITIF